MVKISTDSTCDLPQSVFEALDIDVIPLTINCGENSYKDGIDVKPDDIYRHVDEEDMVCMTAAINSYEYHELFERLLADHDEIVHFCISSDMSACFQNAVIASEAFDNKVFVIDARNLSSGIGLLVLKAVQMAKAGKSGVEIVEAINALIGKVQASFVVNTMDYLKRGGRCSALQAFGAAVLKIKPCIEVVDGKMIVATTYRGSFGRCLKTYVRDRLENTEIDESIICITHSGVSDETIAMVKDEISKYKLIDEVLITRASCTISCHCGPGTLGILFIRA